MIEVSNLSKDYQIYKKEPGIVGSLKSLFAREYFNIKAVNKVSFKIDDSELVGFIGPNGAGKTTTLKMLSGLLYPTEGDISVMGFKPYERKPAFLQQLSLVMGQKNQLWWDLPLLESLMLNKAIYEITDNKFNKTVEELSELMGIQDIMKIQVRKLSLGQRMKAELLASLIHTPKLLFLDEPTLGLDVVAQKKIRDFIKDYNQRYSATVILTSHYMEDVKELCKRIIIIDKGCILYDGLLEKMVEKYATHKIIRIDVEKQIAKSDLEKIGNIIEYDAYKATISVPRDQVITKTSELLTQSQIKDFSVQEIPIEDIVRQIFNQKT